MSQLAEPTGRKTLIVNIVLRKNDGILAHIAN